MYSLHIVIMDNTLENDFEVCVIFTVHGPDGKVVEDYVGEINTVCHPLSTLEEEMEEIVRMAIPEGWIFDNELNHNTYTEFHLYSLPHDNVHQVISDIDRRIKEIGKKHPICKSGYTLTFDRSLEFTWEGGEEETKMPDYDY